MKCGSIKCHNALSSQQEKGGQRFCCRACSNSAIPRISRPESRKKVGESISIFRLTNPQFPKVTKICPSCSKEFTKMYGQRTAKTCSVQCGKKLGGKTAAKTMTERGTHSGWHTRRGELSYPEKYFISVFENEKISGWEYDKKVGRWFVDFAFPHLMLAVEIDGRQHQDLERMESDARKDDFLIKNGWKVIRIPWSNPVSEKGKAALYPHIKYLLLELSNGPRVV